jgi:Protein involved in formate dehydrogenase formation
MRDSWQQRIDRAAHLAERDAAARPLLQAYGRLLGLQRDCYETLLQRADRLTGSLDRDLATVRPSIAPMLTAVTTLGPPPLAEEAGRILDGAATAIDAMLLAGWHAPAGQQFFPKIALQPYAECLAAIDVHPIDRDVARGKYACPFCGGAPQLSILESAGDADGGSRQLQCATCFTRWPFPRVRCARCGEEDERRLGYYRSSAFDHLRVDACDTCKHYLKSVDLTRLGIAVPVVDEVAGAALDLWARDHDYQKIELNLVGL